MTRARKLKFKPYARLLTMLGDQLIKNERVALVELIKNAYDADASWVKVTFEGFDVDFRAQGAHARIIIEDDGLGMTLDVIENHWVNPATPMKLIGKKSKPRTAKKRVIQGEKGIGRFALLKIGRNITITTRPKREAGEYVLNLDVSAFDENFLDGDEGIFLDDLRISLSEVAQAEVIRRKKIELGTAVEQRPTHGTRIEIGALAGIWSRDKVAKVYEDLVRLQSIFDAGLLKDPNAVVDTGADEKDADPFELFIYRDNAYEPFAADRRDVLTELMRTRAAFKIHGEYDEAGKAFHFSINGKAQTIGLLDPRFTALPVYRAQFRDQAKHLLLEDRITACGPFKFSFYVFDLNQDAVTKHRLDGPDRDLIKQHRIYLYRDGIRVYPYGDPADDWLLIDVRRGTVKASEFLSNDQVVGMVEISQADNPNLRDKTSREGLVDVGNATDDFRALLQTFLAWVRKDPYDKLLIQDKKNRTDVAVFKGNHVERSLEDLNKAITEGNTSDAAEKLSEARKQYKAERRYLTQRAENSEHLAGVGLSVEAASHDLMLGLSSALRKLDALIVQAGRKRPIDPELLHPELTSVRGMLSFVEAQMKDMQQLFKSTKQRRQNVRVADVLQKVQRFYGAMLQKEDIDLEVVTVGSPLVANTTEAVLLQLFLNLFDNATFWLEGRKPPRKIEVLLDGDRQIMVFADSGPGFRDDDIPYLFEAFFSGKGEDGRGLGLYIARQLLDRHEYSIEVSSRQDRILPGANLTISFVKGGEQ
jgi:signal transduction histidine kinase